MNFEEWKKTLTFEYDQTAFNLAFHAFQAGKDEQKEKDAQIIKRIKWDGDVGKAALSVAVAAIRESE